MNAYLEEPFTLEDIVEASCQMCPTKAPGLDSLLAAFFQKHWQTVHRGLVETCLYILNEQGNFASLNHTFITLIPKMAKPRKIIEFKPIIFCNIVYRIVAKAIANRLKPILSSNYTPNIERIHT